MSTALFVDHASSLGGAERSLLLLVRHLDCHAWEPRVACGEGALAEQAWAAGIPTSVVDLPRLRRSIAFPWDWWRGARSLAHSAREVNAKVLVANTVRAAFYGLPAARLARTPFVWYMRDFWLSESRPQHIWMDTLLKRLLCAGASRVITNSHAVARHLPCPGKIRVVHNGIDLSAFDPRRDGSSFRSRHKIPLDVPLIGMVGRLRPWKGQHRFVEMADQVAIHDPSAYFVVVGGSPFEVADDYPNRLRQMAAERGLEGRLIFAGHLEDVEGALAAMDVFVHPGDPEPFGLVNVEAMAMGLPVVAFAHGALPEIVVDGETGRLVPPGDVAALSSAVLELLDDVQRRQQWGLAGRARAKRHFSIERTAAEVSAVLKALI